MYVTFNKRHRHETSHEILVSKLKDQFGFSDQAVSWLISHLEHRQQCVRFRNIKTSLLNSRTGLPQGSVLSPILFCLYINDLPNICKESECQMYANDSLLCICKDSRLTSEILGRQMLAVSEWLQKNHLTLNHKKTVSMCFSKTKKKNLKFEIPIDTKEIEVVNKFKYLGVTLDPQLKFDRHTV